MNSILLDLHGLTEEEALPQILTAFITFEDSDEETMEVITGRGPVLTRVVEEMAEEYNFSYYHENGNYGSYIIKK